MKQLKVLFDLLCFLAGICIAVMGGVFIQEGDKGYGLVVLALGALVVYLFIEPVFGEKDDE